VGRLIVVSSRVAVPKRGEPAAGGLAVALRDVLAARGGLWFGWSGEVSAAPEAAPRQLAARGIDYAILDLSEAERQGFYSGYANGSLWPLFHFRTGLLVFDRRDAATYRAVNERFARALAALLEPDDVVWVHDYQLFPLGAALRALGCRQRIGFFLHIPFPPWAVVSALPGAEALLEDLLAYDLVGVQTGRDLAGLADCLRAGLGLGLAEDGTVLADPRGNRALRIGAHPVGIASREFAALARRAAKREEARRLVASLEGRLLVFGAERLDYSKGLPERLRGFAALLRDYKAHRNRVTCLQVAARSRSDVASYRDLRRELDALAGRINGDHAEFDWTPVRYVARALARPTIAAFCRAARVGLVTPLRDGMNLFAKEYVAAQDPADPGVLVLSRFAGAAEALDAALLVNPLDADAIAEALDVALGMALGERRERWQHMWARLERGTATAWAEGFLGELAA
jgi:trehalose 6-phosphate synthase